jgi:hypothetical protein
MSKKNDEPIRMKLLIWECPGISQSAGKGPHQFLYPVDVIIGSRDAAGMQYGTLWAPKQVESHQSVPIFLWLVAQPQYPFKLCT